ncbi:unnamed protein product [Schistosoma curassoni]|uniref:Peptidase_M1 domain-containing protein n=1 Tax=Schistosoma curassoni TaxID=6186 RepID=A0A183KFE3_9TREM|nr:unnamed protein product [Schistosoma curassoni]
MSTYLVAFAVGDLEYTEAIDKNGVLVRVYSRKGLHSEQSQSSIALNVACHCLPFYGEYFGIKYPLPKVDLLAVPNIERFLLANPRTLSPATKEAITTVISHEIAHMWFGNLVTMEWWTDLWLKEGFAAWIEYFCSDHCYPEMDIWTHFSYHRLASALRLDALSSSHPIEVEVSNPNEINEIFDTISYCKGASLINMLHGYLGDSIFRSGLSFYLRRHAYSNAVTDDLWFALTSSCGTNIGSLMGPWTQNTGFPVLSVLLVSINNTSLEAKAGYISVYDWLILLPKLIENENEYSVWRGVLDGLNTYIKRIIQSSDIPSSLYNSFLLKLVYPVINKLGNGSPSKPWTRFKRGRARRQQLTTAEQKQKKVEPQVKYTKANKQVKWSIRADKQKYVEDQTATAGKAAREGNMKQLYDTMRKYSKAERPIKDKEGKTITDIQKQRNR